MTELQYEMYEKALDKYHNDIDCYNLVACYLRLYQYSENTFHGEYDGHEVSVNVKFNKIYVDYDEVTPEVFIEIFDPETNPYLRIYKISDKNYDEYMSDLPFVEKKLNLPKKERKIPLFIHSNFNSPSLLGGQK